MTADLNIPAAPLATPPPELPPIPEYLFCQTCGYNLRGLTGNRCPECGRSLENVRSPVCRIPWVHRKELGRFRAFWKTARMVTFDNRRFCEEFARPVSYRDARAFQRMTVLHGFAALMAVVAGAYATYHPEPVPATTGFWPVRPPSSLLMPDQAFVEVWPVAILCACFLLFLFAATAAPANFFNACSIPVEMRNRGVALSHYACGPLALLILAVPLVASAFLPDVVLLAAIAAAAVCLCIAITVATDFFRRRTVSGVPWWKRRVTLSFYAWAPLAVLILTMTLLAISASGLVIPALPVALVAAGAPFITSLLNLVRLARRTMRQLTGRALLIAIGVPLAWLVLGFVWLVALPFIALLIPIVLASL